MSRSRSSFDLSGAIATAASLSVVVPEEQPAARYRSIPLVSFGPTAAGPPTQVPPPEPAPEEPAAAPHEPPATGVAAPPEVAPVAVDEAPAGSPVLRVEAPAELEASSAEHTRRPPKLPDLSEIKSPLIRCEKIIEWIVEAVGASDVFIADAAGLPIAGAIADIGRPGAPSDDARLAATGVVASAVAHLAAALPGNSSALFEMHVGDGPFFQLIGFDAVPHPGGRPGAPPDAQSYVVGFHRPTPLGFRQAHAVRLACRHALSPNHDGGPPQSRGVHDGGDPQPPGPAGELGPETDPRGPRAMEPRPGGET